MTIFWTAPALRDLPEIWTYIAHDKPDAATHLVSRLREASETLATQPHMGRAGRVPHTRELVVAGTPYVLVYRITARHVEIIAALNGARIA